MHLDMRVYFNHDPFLANPSKETPDWVEYGITYDDDAGSIRQQNLTFDRRGKLAGLWQNRTVYAHVLFTWNGHGMRPKPRTPSDYDNVYISTPMTVHSALRRPEATKHLLTGHAGTSDVAPEDDGVALYWKPSLHATLVDDFSVYAEGGIPPSILRHMTFAPHGEYYPVIYINDFWLTRNKLTRINETVDRVGVEASYRLISMMQWQVFTQMDESFLMQKQMGSMNDNLVEEAKRVLQDKSPALAIPIIGHSYCRP